MGLLTQLMSIAIHMVLIGLDVLVFFAICRTISYRWHPNWLKAINSSGEPAVNWLAATVQTGVRHFRESDLSERESLLLGMLFLMLVRLLVAAL